MGNYLGGNHGPGDSCLQEKKTLQPFQGLGRLLEIGILLLQVAHLFLELTILFFQVYQENIVLKNGADRTDDPMKGALPGREGSQAYIMELISAIAAADLKNNEDEGTENHGNNNERTTASPKVYHLTN
jgi:hypothetical protein